MWEHGEEELSEWSERKGHYLYQLGHFYKRRVIRMKRLLQELIQNSGHPVTLKIN